MRTQITEESKAKLEYVQLERTHLEQQNAIQYTLGDTLDVKCSIALVIIVFLGSEIASILKIFMPKHWHNALLAAILSLVAACLCALFGLFPRIYKVGINPQDYSGWTSTVLEGYKKDCADNPYLKTVAFIKEQQLKKMYQRFAANSRINRIKSIAVTFVFGFTTVALLINVAALLALSTGWRF